LQEKKLEKRKIFFGTDFAYALPLNCGVSLLPLDCGEKRLPHHGGVFLFPDIMRMILKKPGVVST
jgi:hypothetical protein